MSAKIIADSLNTDTGHRLTTFVLSYPRVVHSEFMTHRNTSRNAASSRARPIQTVIDDVLANPYIPRVFDKAHSGMQPKGYIKPGDKLYQDLVDEWLDARDYAVAKALSLKDKGVGKQVVNRLLEPFQFITVICSATDWDNFINLRTEVDSSNLPMADIPIYDLALDVKYALNNSVPKRLSYGDWHIPFSGGDGWDDMTPADQMRVAIARCARVSYKLWDGTTSIDKDLDLYYRLSSDRHYSPLEHVACAVENERFANFSGFKSYRSFLEDGRIK